MRYRWVLLLTGLSIAGSCAEPERPERAQLIEVKPADPSPEAAGRMRDRFQAALETAPLYSSEIRTSLIDNPFEHRASYRSGSAGFANLPKQFRCPHSAAIIRSLASEGWEIVKCNVGGVTFFRRHLEAEDQTRRCLHVAGTRKKDLGDEFETLDVSFPTFRSDEINEPPNVARIMRTTSHYLSGRSTASANVEPFFPLGEFNDATFYERDWGRFIRYYGLDNERQRLVQFDLHNENDCKRNPAGWAVTSTYTIHLDSPQSSIQAMDEALSAIVSLLSDDN